MGEKGEVLLEKSNILSDELVSIINDYLEYEKSENVRIVVLSGEEKLKAVSCAVFGENTSYAINGFSTAQTDVELEDILLSDYLIIHTAAMKMAPLQLTNVLKSIRKFNKKVFVIIDKWNMLPQTTENAEKVRINAIKEFSMVNIIGIYNVGKNASLPFLSIDDIAKEIIMKIEEDYAQTKRQQIEKIYRYLLEIVHKEYLSVKNKANKVREKVEKYANNVNGFHRANAIKIKNVSSELNMYSKALFDKWRLITAEECIGELECDEKEEVRKHILTEYIKLVMNDYSELSSIVKENFEGRLKTLRENILNEMYLVRDKLEGLEYLDSKLLSDFEGYIEELDSVDTMMEQINSLLEDNTNQLEKKVKVIANATFDEETIGGKLKKRIEEFMKQLEQEGASSDEEKLRKAAIVRKYYNSVIEKCNIQLFTEVDIFVGVLKGNIEKKSEKILDKYYIKIEKYFSELETAVEKEYIVI